MTGPERDQRSPGLPNPRGGLQPPIDGATATNGTADRAAEARHELITSLTRNVTARHDLGDVLATTLAELRGLVRFGGASIQLLDDEGWIRLAAAEPAAADDLYEARIPIESTVAGRIVLTERPVYVPDIVADAQISKPKNHLTPAGVRSYFGVPLLAEGHAIGVLQIDSPEASAWDETERMLLSCVAPVVAAAIQNARAHARVAAMEVHSQRIASRHNAIRQLLEADVDLSLRGLVELAEYIPSMRDEVDRLTTAIACVRAVAADAMQNGDDRSVDLRTAEKTRS
jgi:GAF domain-containing protein